MSNYVKSTNFASKDSLSIDNPLKIVKGTEIDTEFNNIATAVATKADLNSPTFLGTPSGPTASSGTSNTQLATTAFVQAALQAVYPVGSIYINTSSTSPATLLGFGTWEAFGAGKVLVGQDTGDTAFDTLEETGGSKDAVVVSHTHSASVSDPGHIHSTTFSLMDDDNGSGVRGIPDGDNTIGSASYNTSSSGTNISVGISTTGSSATNANLQPYVVVKMWKRTA
jgi:hypothetical protein